MNSSTCIRCISRSGRYPACHAARTGAPHAMVGQVRSGEGFFGFIMDHGSSTAAYD